jgi:peptidoglycan/LPS O-acetylase OafA/YrhL
VTLAKVPWLRLVRSRQLWGAVVVLALVLVGYALLEKRDLGGHGLDRALDFGASFVLPALVYGVAAAVMGDARLQRSGAALVSLGAPRGRVALATVLVTVGAAALVSGALGAVVVVVAHGPKDPPALTDALHTFAFTSLGGAAYAAYLAFFCCIVGGAWGRGLALFVDWSLGDGDGMGALLFPRGHLKNVLGGEGPEGVLPWESLLALSAIVVVYGLLAVERARRAKS